MARRTPLDSHFGEALSVLLAVREISQSALAARLGKSVAYLNQTMTGVKRAQPDFVEAIAAALKLTESQRGDLHKAAAKDKGYKIDLGEYK
jgi:transcriptional regulator with XRE-family HTH domain